MESSSPAATRSASFANAEEGCTIQPELGLWLLRRLFGECDLLDEVSLGRRILDMLPALLSKGWIRTWIPSNSAATFGRTWSLLGLPIGFSLFCEELLFPPDFLCSSKASC